MCPLPRRKNASSVRATRPPLTKFKPGVPRPRVLCFGVTALLLLALNVVALRAQSTWTQSSGPVGGHIGSMVNTGSALIVTANPGIYRSTNNGDTWQRLTQGLAVPHNAALTLNGSTLYAGTFQGVHKSTDGGDTWTYLSTGLPEDMVRALTVSGTTLVAGTTNNGVYRSTDGGQNWSAAATQPTSPDVRSIAVSGTTLVAATFGGVFTSADGGQNWTARGITDYEGFSVLTVGSNCYYGTYGGGVYLSTDDGLTWAQTNSGIDDPYTKYVYSDGSKLFAGNLFQSTNGGQTWTRLVNSPANAIISMTKNGTTLFAGTDHGGVYRSSDGGQTWASASAGIVNTSVWDMAATANGATLYAGSFGSGVARSTNNGQSWTQINGGLPSHYIQSLFMAGNGSLYATIYGGNVFVLPNNASGWSAFSGNGLPWTGTKLATRGNTFFVSTTGAGVWRSTDDGQTWAETNNGLTEYHVNKVVVFGNKVYAATANGVFASGDNGATWSPASTGLSNTNVRDMVANADALFALTDDGVFASRDQGQNWAAGGDGLDAYAIKLAVIGDSLYAATGNGVYVSPDAGQQWTHIQNDDLYNGLILSSYSNDSTIFAGSDGAGVYTKSNVFPTVRLTYPVEGAQLVAPATITMAANAAEINGSIAKVKFYKDGDYLGEKTSWPYTYQLTGVAEGTYILSVVAEGASGQTVMSNWATVTVLGSGSAATPPSVAVTAPTGDTIYPEGSNIPVNVNATDNSAVSKVEFFRNGYKIGETSAAPFNFTWANAARGDHTIVARATDDEGTTTDSAPVFLSVRQRTDPVPTSGATVKEYIYVGGRLLATDENLAAGANASLLISQRVPRVMTQGQTYAVSVVLKNIGSTTWTTATDYKLGSQNAQDNTTWGSSRVALPASVAPGQTVTISFNVTAPATPGTYNWQWRMVRDEGAGTWFGEKTFNVSVVVN